MQLFLRAVVTGFGLSLGSALYKKAAKRFGFDDDEKEKSKEDGTNRTNQQDGGTDPGLQSTYA
ncbi:MAG TPA: hypothetical protein VL326_08850 [Kofleriaceae bacterium]|jgi:hypothetical protein|nr:hypothetical protein [Kofleriaceae bacterium]